MLLRNLCQSECLVAYHWALQSFHKRYNYLSYNRGVQSYPQKASVAAGFHSSKTGAHMISHLKTDQLIKQVESNVLLFVWNENLHPQQPFVDKTGHPCYILKDRKSTRLNSRHIQKSRMPPSAWKKKKQKKKTHFIIWTL